ncbi:hypothetical protein HBH70_220780 [Parastagonospora nodorum]|nr:hypothetical protein HBH53_245240 [Parastagonospora nodorum]KAH3968574.1 hypothetical protein HBH52_180760 [Parastagonospora nodorum]KAH3991342.1 hypothetical protein HBI10_235390 [Parastagonospora nodorum]KAH4008867.1 hypothetical protein HBI13_227460 [Parastagonospora nodorum]KAH4012812.1 hypothetical protein HBI09_221050 [Parastagonospora nodorum]
MSATRSPRDLVNPKHIQDRLPSLMGWFSECNTFSVLEEACHVGRLTHERKIYVLRGHSHSVVDGGFIIDPPSDFPSQDPSRAWKWLEQHRNSATIPVRIYRFDAKLNLTSWKSMQWAPFYLVTVADFPEYLCLVPSTAYMNLYAVHRRSTFRTQLNRLGSDSDQHVMVFDNLLALYAVHRDHIYQALVNVVDASSMKTSYVNPTNKVEFCGWNVPQPDITVGPLLRIHEKSQIVSRDSIHRLSGLLETSAGIDLELLMNPLDPLICDFTIWDKQNDVFYLIEHKTRVKTGDKQKDWWDPRHNWHYMLYQQGDDLTIYTRQGERQQDADATPPYTIDISARDAAQRFAVHIRKNGAIARSRLSNKWNKKTGLHESSTSDGEDESESPLDLLKTKSNVLGTQKHTDIRLFASIFASRFNDQCWKLSEHGCILLDNHPSADAAILEHAWTPNEQVEYKKNGTLPVSLVSPSATRQQCVLLRFIPHIEHARAPSTSRLFELSMQTSFAIPACSSQHLMFVASSGGIGTPSDGDFDMDKLVLLSSVDTTMLDGSGTCVPCEDRYQQKRTTFVDQTIGLMDLRAILKDQTAKGTRPVSLTQAPFLKADIQPALKLFSFREGEVHQYFCDLFIDGKSELIDDVYGLHGLLQRQWNHGDSRKIQRLSVDRLMHRILSTLPKQSESFSIDTFKQDLDQKTTQIAKDKSITTVKLARRYALGELINGSDRGIALVVGLTGSSATTPRRPANSASWSGLFVNAKHVFDTRNRETNRFAAMSVTAFIATMATEMSSIVREKGMGLMFDF